MWESVFNKTIFLYFFLMLFFILTFVFLFTRKPISKVLVLAFSYNIVLFFILYNVNLFKVENSIIDFVILITFSCILSVLSGIFIINNIIKSKTNNEVK